MPKPASLGIEITAAHPDGEMLAFSGILARAEVNANGDALTPEGVAEIVATVVNTPITDEHRYQGVVGHVTSARIVDGAAVIDGLIYARRYDKVAEDVLLGRRGLSIEAYAGKAWCSVCGNVQTDENECAHLASRATGSKAVRHMSDMRAFGAGIVRRPAGTNCTIDAKSVAMIASAFRDQGINLDLTASEIPSVTTIQTVRVGDFVAWQSAEDWFDHGIIERIADSPSDSGFPIAVTPTSENPVAQVLVYRKQWGPGIDEWSYAATELHSFVPTRRIVPASELSRSRVAASDTGEPKETRMPTELTLTAAEIEAAAAAAQAALTAAALAAEKPAFLKEDEKADEKVEAKAEAKAEAAVDPLIASALAIATARIAELEAQVATAASRETERDATIAELKASVAAATSKAEVTALASQRMVILATATGCSLEEASAYGDGLAALPTEAFDMTVNILKSKKAVTAAVPGSPNLQITSPSGPTAAQITAATKGERTLADLFI